MSPIRIVGNYSDGTTHIIECMITHKNEYTYANVVEKNMLMTDQLDTPLSYQDVAYRMITSRNSNFLSKYMIVRTDDNFGYKAIALQDSPEISKTNTFLTLQDVMQSVLGRWCEANSVHVEGIL